MFSFTFQFIKIVFFILHSNNWGWYFIYLCTYCFMALLLLKVEVMFFFGTLNFYISALLYTSIGFTLADVYVILKILFGGKKYNHAFVSCCVYIFIEGIICPEIFLCWLEFVLKCKINFSWTAFGCCFKQKFFSMLEKNKGIYFRTLSFLHNIIFIRKILL